MPEFEYPPSGGGDVVVSSSSDVLPAAPAAGELVMYRGRFAGFDVWWTVDSTGRRTPDLSPLKRGSYYAIAPAVEGTFAVPSNANGGRVTGWTEAELFGEGNISHPARTLPGTPATNVVRTVLAQSGAPGLTAGLFPALLGGLRTLTVRSATPRVGGWLSRQVAANPVSPLSSGTFWYQGLTSAYDGTIPNAIGCGWFIAHPTGVHIISSTGVAVTTIPLDGTVPNPAGGFFPALTRAMVQAGRIAVWTGCPPGEVGYIGVRVVDESTGVVHYEGRVTAAMGMNLPAANTGLALTTECGNGPTGADVAIADYGREFWVNPAGSEA